MRRGHDLSNTESSWPRSSSGSPGQLDALSRSRTPGQHIWFPRALLCTLWPFFPPLLCPLASVPSPAPTSLHRNLATPTKRPLKLYCSQRASVHAFEASFANLLMRVQKAGMDFSTVTQPRCNLQFSVVSPKIFRSSSEKQQSFLFNSYCRWCLWDSSVSEYISFARNLRFFIHKYISP